MIYQGKQVVFDRSEKLSLSRIILSEEENPTREEGKTSFSHRLTKYFSTSGIGDALDVINVFCSIFMTLCHAVSTYFWPSVPYILYVIEITLYIIFITHFFLNVYTAENKLLFIFSTSALLEYVSVIPSFLAIVKVYEATSYILLTRSLRFLVAFRMDKILARHSTEVIRIIFKLVTTVLAIMIITASCLFVVENRSENQYAFHDFLYFTVVTLSTVGFGDVTPQTGIGQFIVIGCVLAMLSFFPTQSSQLARVLKLRSKFARLSFRRTGNDHDHIILLGRTNAEAFKNFLTEFYHPDHGVQDTHTVIMQVHPPNDEMNFILKHSSFNNKITFLEGNPIYYKDLKRAKTSETKCVVILASKAAKNPIAEDNRNILEAYAVKNYVKQTASKGEGTNKSVRVCLQVLLPENKDLYYSSLFSTDHDQVICVEELKLQLLAKTCLCPGISTIVTSLITSDKPPAPQIPITVKEGRWINEYLRGMQNEIYRIPFEAEIFSGISFSVVSQHIYKQLDLILFALEVEVNGEVRVFVNPSDYVFEDIRHYGYVIAAQLPNISELQNFRFYEQVQRNYIYNLHQHADTKKGKEDEGNANKKYAHDELIEERDQRNKMFYQGKIASLDQATITSVNYQDFKLENHIIICGIIPGMKHLLLPLRAKTIKHINPIVILHTEPMPTSIWIQINRLPKVYFMQGSPLKLEDLNQLSIMKALSVVILSKNAEESQHTDGTMADADTIFIYKTIKSRNPSIRIITELASKSTISFLSQSRIDFIQKYGHICSEPFASGEIYISTMLDTLICQAYYNPYITSILNQFIMGGTNTSPRMKKIFSARRLHQSNLFLINIPVRFIDKTFGFMFEQMIIEHKMIALGLYRGEKIDGSLRQNFHLKPYVYLKPNADTKLSPKDKVYVLSSKQPKGFDITDLEEEEKNHMAATISEGVAANIRSRLTGEEGKVDTDTARELNKINQELKRLSGDLKKVNLETFSKGLIKPDFVPQIRTALRKELGSFV